MLSSSAEFCIFCKEINVVRAFSVLLLPFCSSKRLSIMLNSAFVMSDDFLNSFIHSKHPHGIHDFAYVMNDDFLNPFIHSQHLQYICMVFSICGLLRERGISY